MPLKQALACSAWKALLGSHRVVQWHSVQPLTGLLGRCDRCVVVCSVLCIAPRLLSQSAASCIM
jgi:hypothetical protein